MLRQCCYLGRRRAERRKEWTHQSVALSRAKERVLWGARSKALAPYNANFRPRRRKRREALRADKRQRRAASDAKMIWTGGLPHLSGFPHLPGVPHLHVKQALILVWKLLSAKVPNLPEVTWTAKNDCKRQQYSKVTAQLLSSTWISLAPAPKP